MTLDTLTALTLRFPQELPELVPPRRGRGRGADSAAQVELLLATVEGDQRVPVQLGALRNLAALAQR